MDVARHELTVDGKPVELTPKEFQILRQLVLHPFRVFSRDELLDQVWGERCALEEHTLDVHIHALRQKIEPDAAHPRYIATVRGIGYKLIPQ
jgi:DNA-binding response OmpR family regulator